MALWRPIALLSSFAGPAVRARPRVRRHRQRSRSANWSDIGTVPHKDLPTAAVAEVLARRIRLHFLSLFLFSQPSLELSMLIAFSVATLLDPGVLAKRTERTQTGICTRIE